MKKNCSLHHPIKFLALTFLILLGSASTSKAQTEELTLYFSAYDSVTLLNVPIDSVVIANISRQDTVAVYGPNPEITLQWTGIAEPGVERQVTFQPGSCYPNPFYGTSTVEINVWDRQQLQIRLLGPNGVVLSELQDQFNPGRHFFRITTGQHNLCFLSVSDGKVSRAVKLINMSPTRNSIAYVGMDEHFKSGKFVTEFDFSPGDTLHYSIFAEGYFEFNSEDTPQESTGYTFELLPLPDYDPPSVSIFEIMNVTGTSAICSGEVTDDGGAAVTARGICWSESPQPSIDDDTTHCGQGTGNFYGYMNNLILGNEYYVRAWATNSEGVAYSEESLAFESMIWQLYVPGDYQGWDPSAAPIIYDFDGDAVYNGYIFFPEGGTLEFKFSASPNWDNLTFGYGGEGILSVAPGADNLSVPQPGGYMIEAAVIDLTWSYDLQNWGVIGEWLGWAEDIDMVWDIETQDLSVTVENIPPAENQRFHFRANDAWENNLGSVYPPDGETLVPDGNDIPIPDGGTITFILRFTTPMPTYDLIYR